MAHKKNRAIRQERASLRSLVRSTRSTEEQIKLIEERTGIPADENTGKEMRKLRASQQPTVRPELNAPH